MSNEVGTFMNGSESDMLVPEDELQAALADIESMNGSESDPLVPEDELQAALAEIEKMSGEHTAAIPSLDDGRGVADDSGTDVSAPEPESPPPDTADTLAAQNATTPSATASVPEVESAAPVDQPDTVTKDTDGPPADVDTAAATLAAADAALARVESSGEQEPQPGAEQVPDGGEPKMGASSAAASPEQKRLHFKIGQRSAKQAAEEVAEYRPPEERDDAAPPVGAARPVAPLAKRVFRALDRGLDAINRPFARLGGAGRAMVGWAALATLTVSILAIVLMPLLLPHRDAVTFLQEKRARLAPPPSDATSDPVPLDEE